MRAVVLVFHGSVQAAAKREAAAVTAAVRRRLADVRVMHAFLRGISPTVPETLASAAAEGAKQIDLLPLLVLRGRHMARDLPALLRAAKRTHPGVAFRLLPHLGAEPRFGALLAVFARRARSQYSGGPQK